MYFNFAFIFVALLLTLLLLSRLYRMKYFIFPQTETSSDCKTNYGDPKRASAREIFKYFNCTNYVATKFNYILLLKRS